MSRSMLKPGWRKVKFGDVVRQCKEKADPETSGLERYVAGDHMDTDDLRIRRWGEIGSGYLGPAFHMRFRPGQVLYGSRRTYLRKVAVADFDGICANTTFVLEPKDAEELNPKFLPFLMQTNAFNEFSVKNSKGSVNPYINFSDLARFEFALPPMGEQIRIQQLLSEVVEVREQLLEVAKSSRRLLLSTLETTWGSPSTAQRMLSDIATHLTSGSRGWAEHYSESGNAIFLRITNVQRNTPRLDLSDIQMVNPPDTLEANRTRVMANDVLLSITAELGLVACIPRDLGVAHVNQHLALVRVDPNIANSKYVAWYLCSPSGQRQIARFNDSGAKAGMNLKNVAAIQIPWMELSAQEAIANQLDEIESALVQALAREKELSDFQKMASQDVFGECNVV